MAHIYWEKKEIPIPEGAHINRHDGRVFVFLREGDVLAKSRRIVIGHATSMSTMHPNDSYKQMYPALWKEHYGENEVIKEHQLNSGMYATCLGIGYKTGVYGALMDTVGPLVANAVMDLSMYSILEKSNVAMTFNERMKSEVVFSKKLPNDSWISEMYSGMIDRNSRMSFCDMWIELCKERGVTKVWISVDGTNDDCCAVKCDLAEKGKSKSKRNNNIVYMIYAVSAETGMPLMYKVLNGGMVDAKAIMDVVTFLHSHGIDTEGLILDRGLCSSNVFSVLEELKYPYIVMLKNDTFSHLQAYDESSSKIRMNLDYILNSNAVFGISMDVKRKIFKNDSVEAYINLFYDGENGSERSLALIKKVMMTAEILREKATKGETLEIPDKLAKYIEIRKTETGTEVCLKKKEWQDSIDRKGFYSIASDKNYGAKFVHSKYHLRDASEKGYSEIKTQLGFEVLRNHSTEGIENKLFVCFVSSILRTEMIQAAKAVGIPTNQMIREIDRMHLFLTQADVYAAIHNESERQKKFLKSLNVLPEDFDSIAADVNTRVSPITSQRRQIQRIEQEKKEAEKARLAQLPKRGRGRPKGSKSAKNNESVSDTAKTEKPKGKPGRPKGSKNKKTLAKEKRQATTTQTVKAKRKPGRPKGSRNKKNLELMKKHRIGRPPGSKNKPKHPAK